MLHALWVIVPLVVAVPVLFSQSHGIIRWVFVGALVYGAVSWPWILAFMARMRWNAAEAERRNRELLDPAARP